MEVDKNYYIILHAYHHFLVTVQEIHGPRFARFSRIVKVHSCRRGWTEFFRDGCMNDTTMMEFPPGELSGWIGIFDWKHPIPTTLTAAAE